MVLFIFIINVILSENFFEGFVCSYIIFLILIIFVGVVVDINVVVVVEMYYLISFLIIVCFVEKKFFCEYV